MISARQLSYDRNAHDDCDCGRLDGLIVGIVAGWGNYPIEVAKSLKARGATVVVAALAGHASPQLREHADQFADVGLAKMGAHRRYFRRHGVQRVVLAGKIFKQRILFGRFGYASVLPDWTTIRTFVPHFISRRKDGRDDTLLHAVVDFYGEAGMPVEPGTHYAPHLLAEAGVLTERQPNYAIQKDIEFGWSIAKAMGALDVGQAITVRDQAVLAVEAIEGTDACIQRTAVLCKKGGFTLIKVAKPQQDERFDLPTVGPNTIRAVADARGSAIVIEEGKTILIDRGETLQLADQLGVCIVSLCDYTYAMSRESDGESYRVREIVPMASRQNC